MNTSTKLDISSTPHPSAENHLSGLLSGESITPETNIDQTKALIQITGQMWRLGSLLFEPDTSDLKSELSLQDIKKMGHAVETMREVIELIGIRVIDRCNEDFHPGLPDTVVTEEPQEGISKERIIRTIRPTIMWGQTMVQRGEIDIAVPVTKKEEN
jgi:hypothetical protein